LELRDPIVVTNSIELMDVAGGMSPAEVVNGLHPLSEFVIVRQAETTFTGTHYLTVNGAERTNICNGPRKSPFVERAASLSRVFYYSKVILLSNFTERVHVCRVTCEVNYHDTLGEFGYGFLNLTEVQVVSITIDIREDWYGILIERSACAGNKCKGLL